MPRTISIERLIKAIENLEDDRQILELYQHLGISLDGIYEHQLSGEELHEIREAQEEYKRGESKDHEEVMTHARKWIKK